MRPFSLAAVHAGRRAETDALGQLQMSLNLWTAPLRQLPTTSAHGAKRS